MSKKTVVSRFTCIALFIFSLFALTACNSNPSILPPTVDPGLGFDFIGRQVNWNGRAGSRAGHELNRNGTANLGHIYVERGRNPQVTVRFSLPGEVDRVRILGTHPESTIISSNFTALSGNSLTLDFGSRGNRMRLDLDRGTIVFWVEGSSAGQTQSGYFSITFVRVDRLPSDGATWTVGPPLPGRQARSTRINSIPTQFHGTHLTVRGGGSVTVESNRIVLTRVELNPAIRIGDGRTPPMYHSLTTDVRIQSIYQAPWGDIHVRAFYLDRGLTDAASMDINIGPGGLIVSNVFSYMAQHDPTRRIYANRADSNNLVNHRLPPPSDPQHWVGIRWVTVRAFTSGGDLIGVNTHELYAIAEIHAPYIYDACFEGWFIDGDFISSNPVLVFSAVENMDIEARFIEQESPPNLPTPTPIPTPRPVLPPVLPPFPSNDFNVSANPANPLHGTTYVWNGLEWIQSNVRRSQGQRTWVEARANWPYEFESWTVVYGNIGLEDTFSARTVFYMSNGNVSLRANFRQVLPQTSHIFAWSSGGGSVSGYGVVTRGELITIQAWADSGWEFDGWFESGNFIAANATQVFDTWNDRTIEARFRQVWYGGWYQPSHSWHLEGGNIFFYANGTRQMGWFDLPHARVYLRPTHNGAKIVGGVFPVTNGELHEFAPCGTWLRRV